MDTENIIAVTIDEAAEQILEALKEDTGANRSISSRDNVIYFDGWDGLGASAVLRAIGQRLTEAGQGAPAGLQFDQIIQVDCSKWQSRRALQRAVAEQLKLPAEVMEMFDREDEEDDFRGVAQGSRAELQKVGTKMYQHMIQKMNYRILVIFHNGSSEEIDLSSLCGIPLSGYSTNKVLWTFQGRFRLKPRTKVDMAMKRAGMTDAFIMVDSSIPYTENIFSYLVHQEAQEVVPVLKISDVSTHSAIHQPAQVANCFKYTLELCYKDRHLIDYDWATHGANYWVCDGIIPQLQQGDRDVNSDCDDDGLWKAANGLQREMQLDVDHHQYSPSIFARFCVESKPYWTSPTSGFTLIQPDGAIRNGDMFQHCSEKLSVLKLSCCTFDFQAPPFLCCHGLRFLWLDHCQDTEISTYEEGKEEDLRRCFQRLWVLDVRHTSCDHILSARMMDLMTHLRELNVMGAEDWDMGQLQGRLPNIRRLRVTESIIHWYSCSENDLFSEMNKLELLHFSGNIYHNRMTRLSGPGVSIRNNGSCLETVVIVENGALQHISFRGCNKLSNILLSGWMGYLRTLDISGTAVKTLDLTAVLDIKNLDELCLLECEKLCAILWPPKDQMRDDLTTKLCIGTTLSASSREEKAREEISTSATTGTSASATVTCGNQRTREGFDWYVSVRDARLLLSLVPVYSSREIHVEICSPTTVAADSDSSRAKGIKNRSENQVLGSLQHTTPAIYCADTATVLQQEQAAAAKEGYDIASRTMWACPDAPDLPQKSCYLHIQDQTTRTKLPRGGAGEGTRTVTVPKIIVDCARILHVHDSLSFTGIPNDGFIFIYMLTTLWVSQLPKARYISSKTPYAYDLIFPNLTFLHLDLCPRLIHVLPFSREIFDGSSPLSSENMSFSQLETLEIVWCGDLREVFPLDDYAKGYLARQQEQARPITTLDFPSLKRIHLHEVPALRGICGGGLWMLAPKLEAVKVRGCWSLTRLPVVVVAGGDDEQRQAAVECDCEKDWWDRLEWKDGSHASRYKPIHSKYYKKAHLPITSVLG